MLFSSVITSALLLAGAALAQKATGTPTDTTTDTATGTASGPTRGARTSTGTSDAAAPTGSEVSVMVVKVSNKDSGQVMEPNSMFAPVGSMIQFQFYPKVSTSAVTSFKGDF